MFIDVAVIELSALFGVHLNRLDSDRALYGVFEMYFVDALFDVVAYFEITVEVV